MKTREERFQATKTRHEAQNVTVTRGRSWVGQCRAAYTFSYRDPSKSESTIVSRDLPCDEAAENLEWHRHTPIPRQISLAVYQPGFFNTRRIIFFGYDLNGEKSRDVVSFVQAKLDDETRESLGRCMN